MTKFKTLMLTTLAVALAGSAAATGASAETYLQATHPRRAEVNHRLAVENHRIRVERREGLVGPRKAAILHARLHEVRREERIDARFNRGHITRGEQRALNRQETGVGRALNR